MPQERDRATVVKLLNEALATEIVCVLRYMHHYFMATGIHAADIVNTVMFTAIQAQQE